MKIPNYVPEHEELARIAVIGTIPDKDDKSTGIPFNSKGATMLRGMFKQLGVPSNSVMYANLDQWYEPNKRYSSLSDTAQISAADLKRDLGKFRPNIIILTSATALKLAGIYHKLDDYRGSLFKCGLPTSPFYGFKCIATYDPQFVITAAYKNMPLLKFDTRKAISESRTNELKSIPIRKYDIDLTVDQILERLDKLDGPTAADIEGYIQTGITCIGIAESSTSAFIIPFKVFSPEDTAKIVLKMREVFRKPTIKWIYQHGLFDVFALAWVFGIHHGNFWWDTMISGFEIYPELPKSLAMQTSLWTNEPFYKAERKDPDMRTHFTYCCKDACVTYEIAMKHNRHFNAAQREHFEFNMSVLPALLYMELRGMKYDREKANELLAKMRVQMEELNVRINTRVGHSVNVNSPKQLTNVLYNELGLPKQHPPKKVGRGKDTTKLTADVNALLELTLKNNHPIIYEILGWRKLEKMRSSLEIVSNDDGRVRCEFNVVGTETNRLSCSKSKTGSGTNMQTITKKLRPLYSGGLAVSPYNSGDRYFFQVDLAGADGWTVAAHCNALGDPTMLDDYFHGIKPARVIGLMYTEGASVSQLDRATLHSQSKGIGDGDTEHLYFTCKQVQHGTNYGLGPNKMVQLIAKQSYKLLGRPIRSSVAECSTLQELYMLRYKGVKRWQVQVENQIKSNGAILSATGHTRPFFGRRADSETYRKAYAQEPQHNTTYATNRALVNLWNDPDNRNPDGSLIIEPLHQVHDALNGSFPVERLEWATAKIRSYFDFSIRIAGQDIHIPFEGEYGLGWGHAIGKF